MIFAPPSPVHRLTSSREEMSSRASLESEVFHVWDIHNHIDRIECGFGEHFLLTLLEFEFLHLVTESSYSHRARQIVKTLLAAIVSTLRLLLWWRRRHTICILPSAGIVESLGERLISRPNTTAPDTSPNLSNQTLRDQRRTPEIYLMWSTCFILSFMSSGKAKIIHMDVEPFSCKVTQ